MNDLEVKLMLVNITNHPKSARETIQYLSNQDKEKLLETAKKNCNDIALKAIEKAEVLLEEEQIIKLSRLKLSDSVIIVQKMSDEEKANLQKRMNLLGRELNEDEKKLVFLLKTC